MGNNKITIKDLAEFHTAYSHYISLQSYFPHLDSKQIEKLNAIWTENGSYEGPYWDCKMLKNWEDVNIHITSQTWGSTSCGWGGIGGAAMTTSFNFIIHQKITNLYFVYWGGKLAYIIEKDKVDSLDRLPSLSSAKALYKSR